MAHNKDTIFNSILIQEQVFETLSGSPVIYRKTFLNWLYADSKPSACYKKTIRGKVLLRDYGANDERFTSVDCVAAVMLCMSLKFNEAIDWIHEVVIVSKGHAMTACLVTPRETPTKKQVWTPIKTISVLPENIIHWSFGLPNAVYNYRNADGTTRFYQLQFNFSDGTKQFPTYVAAINQRNLIAWRWMFAGFNRPLYNLPEIIARPDARVLIVEGEKCATIARKQFPEFVCTTWSGGANSEQFTDWSPLFQRDCYLFPDHDSAGYKVMSRIAHTLTLIGAERTWINPFALAPIGWDCADPTPLNDTVLTQSELFAHGFYSDYEEIIKEGTEVAA